MSPHPPLSASLLKCKNLSDGFKYVTGAACSSFWKLLSLVEVTVEDPRAAFASAAHSSGEVGTLISGIQRFLLSLMTTSHTSVLCGGSTSLGCSQSQESSARLCTSAWRSLVPSLRSSAGHVPLARPCLLQLHCLLRPAEARTCRWCDLVAFSPAECERFPNSSGIVGIRATQDSTTRGPRASPARSPRVRRYCQFHSARVGNCSHLSPLSTDLDLASRTSPPALQTGPQAARDPKPRARTRRPTWWGAQQIFGYVRATPPHFVDKDDGPTRGRSNATYKKERYLLRTMATLSEG